MCRSRDGPMASLSACGQSVGPLTPREDSLEPERSAIHLRCIPKAIPSRHSIGRLRKLYRFSGSEDRRRASRRALGGRVCRQTAAWDEIAFSCMDGCAHWLISVVAMEMSLAQLVRLCRAASIAAPKCATMEKIPDIDCRCNHSACEGKAH